MAFGIDRNELKKWKKDVSSGEIAFLTHYWMDERFPGCYSVTKVGCIDIEKLIKWGVTHNLQPQWIHRDPNYPHFDLFGDRQKRILIDEGMWHQIEKFNL
ncbi:hypothetical protein [Virgibacillus ihumii]|uniref:hypothetical protein n=1 Tax=Virgibacillus ihumii TaxID=2686091 RepID=UPI00157CA868|nr:hypothetical protein [Virgibacillus ihumii]